jgi:hypothetical protein
VPMTPRNYGSGTCARQAGERFGNTGVEIHRAATEGERALREREFDSARYESSLTGTV